MDLVKKIFQSELDSFAAFYKEALTSDVPLLNDIFAYLLKNKGKQIRPVFSLLCARLGGELNEGSYRAASIVEMLHTASLLHDDVLDESMERRGVFSINAIWKNKAAVIAGDCLSLNALLLTLTNKDYLIFEIYAEAINIIVNGELLQYKKTFRLNLDEETYFEIIKAKTAAFFAAACASGASTTFTDQTQIDKLYLLGERLGIAFQIKDDLLDYGKAAIGKPTGNDLRDKKLTLPLIYTLNTCPTAVKKEILKIIRKKNKDTDSINHIIDIVHQTGGIAYAQDKMLFYRDSAIDLLSGFPASDIRSTLEELVRYTTERVY